MQEDLALTFKQLLCPLLVVNRAAKNCWNIDRLNEKKKNLSQIEQAVKTPTNMFYINATSLCAHF